MNISGTYVYIADDLPKWPLPDWIARVFEFENWDDLYHWMRIWTLTSEDGA